MIFINVLLNIRGHNILKTLQIFQGILCKDYLYYLYFHKYKLIYNYKNDS